jgi:uncharacterized membrane protein
MSLRTLGDANLRRIMNIFWLALVALLVIAFFAALSRRKRYESVEDEPWRASLQDDEPLDMDAAREAEEEWLQEEWGDDGSNESWRG